MSEVLLIALINRAADVNISRNNFARQTKSGDLREFGRLALTLHHRKPKIHLIGDRPSEAIQEKRHH